MEPHLLRIQALVFKWVGLGWLACGLLIGNDPVNVIWRAALAAFVTMLATGILLRLSVNHITSFLAAQLADEAEPETAGSDGPAGPRR